MVQEEVVRLKDCELSALEPEFNEDFTVKEFKSPALKDFSLEDKVAAPSHGEINAPMDVDAEKGASHWVRAVKSGSERSGHSISVSVPAVKASAKESEEIVDLGIIDEDIAEAGGDIVEDTREAAGGGLLGSEDIKVFGGNGGGGGGSGGGISGGSSSGGGGGYNTRSSASRRIYNGNRSVLHAGVVELSWDCDRRTFEAEHFLENDTWPTEEESIQ